MNQQLHSTRILDIEGSFEQGSQTIILHGGKLPKRVIKFETNTALAEPTVWDGFVCAVIFDAMRLGHGLKVRGALSQQFYRNIHAFQEAWHCLCPSLYQVVGIEAQEVITNSAIPKEQKDSAIMTFSGGIDSTFTLLRNQENPQSIHRYPIKSALLVHGFDIPYANQSAFNALLKQCQSLTEVAGVELHALRTTIREDDKNKWIHSHGAALASALHLFSHHHSLGLVASSDPYDYISYAPYAWGSSAATDHLLSGTKLEMIHHGAGFSRPEKIAYLAEHWPRQLELTQFCWEGNEPGINCGHCDKCVHTRLSLLAGGFDETLCFDTKFDIRMLNQMRVNEKTLGDIMPLLDFAKNKACKAEWTRLLRDRSMAFLPVPHHMPNRSLGRSVRYLRAALREIF